MQHDQVAHAAAGLPAGSRWSVSASLDGSLCLSAGSDEPLLTASVGKVFLLVAVAEAFESGRLDPQQRLSSSGVERVQDSGLWQYFAAEPLTAHALATLVGAVSDNLATNVLLDRLTLDAVQEVSVRLGTPQSILVDRIRDERPAGVPEHPSKGRSRDLVVVMDEIAGGDTFSPQVAADVRGWLTHNCDLSMVASAWDLDPLAHSSWSDGLRLFNKTGTDVGVRADIGHVATGRAACSYAAIVNWPEAANESRSLEIAAVMAFMHAIGQLIRDEVLGPPRS